MEQKTTPKVLTPTIIERATPILITQLKSPHLEVRRASAFTLSVIKPTQPTIKQKIIQASFHLGNPHARTWLLQASIHPELKHVRKWYKDPSPNVRITAIRHHPNKKLI